MGRRNAFTFAKRQRELEKKKKKEAKQAARQQRKDDGLDPDLEPADDDLSESGDALPEGESDPSAAPAPESGD